MAAEGLEVTLASGGPPVPGIAWRAGVRLVQLPPASAADLAFKTLVDDRGREIDAEWKRRRCEALLAAWRAADPHVLVLELFPFGRRQMRFELLPLLEAAARRRAPPGDRLFGARYAGRRRKVRSGRRRRSASSSAISIACWCTPILAVIAIRAHFPARGPHCRADRVHGIRRRCPRQASGKAAGKGEVIVSAGGGAVGAGLLDAAIRARPLTVLRDRTWRVLAGNNLPDDEFP